MVTPVRGRATHLARQRTWLARVDPAPAAHVVVVMGGPDPAPVLTGPGPAVHRLDVDPGDGPLPLARARNAGVAAAVRAGADAVLLLDVDVLPLPDLTGVVTGALAAAPTALHLGTCRYLARGSLPTPARWAAAWAGARPDPRAAEGREGPAAGAAMPPELLWSLLFAVTPATWERTGGFHEGYVGYGAEDTDLGMACAAAGVPLRWCPGARGLHQWHGTGDPATRAADLVRNATTFRDRWGWWPMQEWLAELDARGLVRFDPAHDRCELVPAGAGPGAG